MEDGMVDDVVDDEDEEEDDAKADAASTPSSGGSYVMMTNRGGSTAAFPTLYIPPYPLSFNSSPTISSMVTVLSFWKRLWHSCAKAVVVSSSGWVSAKDEKNENDDGIDLFVRTDELLDDWEIEIFDRREINREASIILDSDGKWYIIAPLSDGIS